MGREGLDALEARTKAFAVDVIQFCRVAEREPGLRQIATQLIASAASVSANHRAMRRARSTKEFAAKLQIVNEEIDESVHWLEIVAAVTQQQPPLLKEALGLRAIFAKARSTLRQRL